VPPISRPRLIGAAGDVVIGVCTYNRGPQITQTLQALAALDPVRANGAPRLSRIIVINNRSTDDTPAVVDRFIAGNRGGGIPIQRLDEPTPGKTHAMRRFFRQTSEPFACII